MDGKGRCIEVVDEVYSNLGLPIILHKDDVYFLVERDNKIVATICLNPHAGFFYDLFDYEIDCLNTKYNVGYISKFASTVRLTKREITSLIDQTIKEANKMGIGFLVAGVTPQHAKVYAGVMGCQVLTGIRTLTHYDKQLVLIGRETK